MKNINEEKYEMFKRGECVIGFDDKEEFNKFMKHLDTTNITWGGGTKPSLFTPLMEVEKLAIRCEPKDNRIFYGSKRGYKNVISFKELIEGVVEMKDKEVSFMDAVQAFDNGNIIECKLKGVATKYEPKGILKDGRTLRDQLGLPISQTEILEGKWYIKENIEYLTFDEARKSGKRFKHKGYDCGYMTLYEVVETFRSFTDRTINTLLDEKAWEVEE